MRRPFKKIFNKREKSVIRPESCYKFTLLPRGEGKGGRGRGKIKFQLRRSLSRGGRSLPGLQKRLPASQKRETKKKYGSPYYGLFFACGETGDHFLSILSVIGLLSPVFFFSPAPSSHRYDITTNFMIDMTYCLSLWFFFLFFFLFFQFEVVTLACSAISVLNIILLYSEFLLSKFKND